MTVEYTTFPKPTTDSARPPEPRRIPKTSSPLRDELAMRATDGDVASISDACWVDGNLKQLSRSERRYKWADAMLAERSK